MSVDIFDDFVVYLDEVVVVVLCKLFIVSFFSDGFNGVVRDVEVEDGVYYVGY